MAAVVVLAAPGASTLQEKGDGLIYRENNSLQCAEAQRKRNRGQERAAHSKSRGGLVLLAARLLHSGSIGAPSASAFPPFLPPFPFAAGSAAGSGDGGSRRFSTNSVGGARGIMIPGAFIVMGDTSIVPSTASKSSCGGAGRSGPP